ncbi:MAG: alpha/beta hydrolase [Pseudomonadota bacterium]
MQPYFLSIRERWQHVWVAGKGAPLLLIHGSPNRALTLRPIIEHLSKDFLVLAPDTPGNGYSEALPEGKGRAEHYAAALLDVMDTLGIDAFGVYGFHTGATLAAELAVLAPTRLTAVALDGFPLWTADEAAALDDRYLTPMEPSANGAHLAAVWSRALDQNLFFPWYDGRAQSAIDYDLSELDRLHSRTMDFLNAGPSYIAPYRTALRPDGQRRVMRLADTNLPVLLLAERSDVLASHAHRLPPESPYEYEILPGIDERFHRIRQFFRHAPTRTLDARLQPTESTRRYVQPQQLDLRDDEWIFADLPRSEPTAIWLHELGSSHKRGHTSALRLDLPGHGFSSAPWPKHVSKGISLVQSAIGLLGLDDIPITGDGLGAEVAKHVADMTAGKTRPAITMAMPHVPDIHPTWEGAHLLRAWHYARLKSQYRDWTTPTVANRIRADMPTPGQLQERTLDLLRAGPNTLSTLGRPIL